MAQQIIKIFDKVKLLLQSDPRLRDSDAKLKCRIWTDELAEKKIAIKNITAYEFFLKLISGDITDGESIGRARRRVQEMNPLLRGNTYAERKKKEEVTKHEIRSVS